MKTSLNILISGGGTGGHIFPAIAIADEWKKRYPNSRFLFVGARDKMEMQKIPANGYDIEGLWISGLNRSNKLKNLSFPFKVTSSLWKSHQILKNFKPDFALGTGGFASGPALFMASRNSVPIFLQEQNSFPGITNKLLKNKAEKIFVAYDGMESYFPSHKIINAGNPVRESLFQNKISKEEARIHLGLQPDKLTILNVGGSLGSRTLNNAWLDNIENLNAEKVQLLWQTGSLEYQKITNSPAANHQNIFIKEFIQEMSYAYAAADIIVSRAGAIAISEMCLAGKPVLLVPFPFAAEDHQTKNAENLVAHNAALMVKDIEINQKFWPTIQSLIQNETLRSSLAEGIKKLAKPHATQHIVDQMEKSLHLK